MFHGLSTIGISNLFALDTWSYQRSLVDIKERRKEYLL